MNTERAGWGTPVVLVLLTATFSVVNTGLLLFLPLALLLIAVPPRRPALIGFGGVLLVIGLIGPAGDSFWWFGRGWALIVAAWFVGAVALDPDAGFINRGIGAVLGSIATAAVIVAIRSGWAELDFTLSQRLRASTAQATEQLATSLSGRAWAAEALEGMRRTAEIQATLYPALLALASLSGLAVAWWLWRRLTLREARPLARLRDFRFRDELVWLAVIAVVLLVLPLGSSATRAGTNLAVFMGALYAVRGLAVLVSMYGPFSVLNILLIVVLTVFIFPIVASTTLILGLLDTWMDLRTRAAQARGGKP